MYKVFVDGQEGTTGLAIHERLSKRADVEVLQIDPEKRKDPAARAALLNAADAAILCLPDDAARESVSLVTNPHVRVLDTSTAHRTAEGWAYGLPELSGEHRRNVECAHRIAVPGCHATGFIAAVYPLVAPGLLSPAAQVSCHSVTGYSGGGKKMIAQYQDESRPGVYNSPRQYALSMAHKHLPEMARRTGLQMPPAFNPIVADFYQGMAVSIPLHASQLEKPMTRAQLEETLAAHYAGQRFVTVKPAPEDGFLPANLNAGTNDLTLYVIGNDEMFTLVSVFDNLGKGASGAAMQCMNIALGIAEDTGF